jgi:hypothetical protein
MRWTHRQLCEAAQILSNGRKHELEPSAAWSQHLDLLAITPRSLAGLGLGYAAGYIQRLRECCAALRRFQRHEYREERRRALLAWSQRVTGIVGTGATGSNVIALKVG